MFEDHDRILDLEERVDGEMTNEERFPFRGESGMSEMTSFVMGKLTPDKDSSSSPATYSSEHYIHRKEGNGEEWWRKEGRETAAPEKIRNHLQVNVLSRIEEVKGVSMRTYEREGNTSYLIDIKGVSKQGPVGEINGNLTMVGCKIMYTE